jgi:hypothetical protein
LLLSLNIPSIFILDSSASSIDQQEALAIGHRPWAVTTGDGNEYAQHHEFFHGDFKGKHHIFVHLMCVEGACNHLYQTSQVRFQASSILRWDVRVPSARRNLAHTHSNHLYIEVRAFAVYVSEGSKQPIQLPVCRSRMCVSQCSAAESNRYGACMYSFNFLVLL